MTGTRPGGMRGYTVLWVGQVLSVSGARMVNFSFGVWLFLQTHSTVDLTLMTMAAFVSTMLCSPFAGTAIDRFPRRLTIVASDAGSAVVMVVLLGLFAVQGVQVWQLFAANLLIGAFVAFQAPAYSATISVMVAKEHYSRANAMRSMAESVPTIIAPIAAAALLQFLGIGVVVAVAIVASLVAVATVFLVRIPEVDRTGVEVTGWWRGAGDGFRYIAARPGLIGVQSTFFIVSFLSAMGGQVLAPMVLQRTDGNELAAGLVQTVGAVGGVVGGVVMVLLPTPRRRMYAVLVSILFYMTFGRIMLGMGDNEAWWAAGWFCAWVCMPFLRGHLDGIWQTKVDPAMQGRVFGARQVIDNLALPISLGTVGPLVDYLLEPGMQPGGSLLPLFGGVVDSGPGAGMALVFVGTGVLGVLVGVVGFVVRAIRDVDTELPDHDALPRPASSTPVPAAQTKPS